MRRSLEQRSIANDGHRTVEKSVLGSGIGDPRDRAGAVDPNPSPQNRLFPLECQQHDSRKLLFIL